MKLAERLAKRRSSSRGYHTAIVTSFAVEFGGFEEVMLPQLAAAGATNVLLVADERMSALALTDGSILPQHLGRDYVLHGPRQSSGVFHPKIVLQLGRDGGRAFVGSANATASGIGGNLEVVTEVACGTDASPERDFVRSVWAYLRQTVADAEGAARDAVAWAQERTPWLVGEAADPPHLLEDGSAIALIARPGGSSISQRFVDLVGDGVERLVVLSPYWDEGLSALRSLRQRLGGPATTVLLDPTSHDFPGGAPGVSELRIVDVSDWAPNRFKHAKVIVAQTAEHDHVLAGSANCTSYALGVGADDGDNSEAGVYRRVPRGDAVEAMGLASLIDGSPLDVATIPRPERAPPIELDKARLLAPGRFEAEHGELHWTPAGRDWAGSLVMLDVEAQRIGEVPIDGMSMVGEVRRLRVDILDQVHFVQIEDGGTSSTVAPLYHRGLLRGKRREAATKAVASAASLFVDRADLQLFLLQALDELERADADIVHAAPRSMVRTERPEKDTESAPAEILSYERFVEQRRDVRRGAGGDSSLSGSQVDGVRELLNRLSGMSPAHSSGAGGGSSDWMDLGDEDVAKVMVRDVAEVVAEEKPPADRQAFLKAVRTYEGSMAGGPDAKAIGGADVLRLRFWLLLLVHAARWSGYDRGLPCSIEEVGWPRMVVRILSAFFFRRDAPIARLVMEGSYADLPVDFLETWATALWVLDLATSVLGGHPSHDEFLKRIPMLRLRMVQRMGLSTAEFEGEVMSKVRLGLDRELGGRFPPHERPRRSGRA